MRRQAIESLKAAIEANTEKRSIEQLQAQGKRHVRVVSGEKVLKIIKAIVNDIVDREVGEASQADRDRIVSETKQQFDRVLKLQTEQDALVQEQKELVSEYRAKLKQAETDRDQARGQLEKARSEQAAREGRMLAEYQEKVGEAADQLRETADLAKEHAREKERLARELADVRAQAEAREERLKAEAQQRLEQLHKEQRDLVARFEAERGDVAGRQEQALADARARASDLETRLAEASEAKVVLDQKAERLESDLAEARAEGSEAAERARKAERIVAKQEARFAKARTLIENAQQEMQRLTAENGRLQAELAQLRERAGESDAVQQLRGELEGMKSFLQAIEEKSAGANEATVSSLLERLSERETFNSSSLEEKFNKTLDASLDKITRTMEAATARPIDVVVEATDVLVDKIFDFGEDQMSTNLGKLNVQQSTSKSGIAGNLQALKKMRAAQSAGGGDQGGDAKKADAKDEKAQAKEIGRASCRERV